jgi:AI-2 transport protein TqsA
MIPFVLAIFVVVLVSPILDFQVIRLRFPRSIAVVTTFLVVMVIIGIICLLVTLAVQNIIATAGDYSEDFGSLADRAISRINQSKWVELDRGKIVGDLRNEIPRLVTNTLGTAFGFLSSVFFVLIFVIYLLAGRNPHVVRSGVYADIDLNIRRYIGTKVVISTLTGFLVWATLRAVGLELAGVFGAFAFLLNFIPSIGSMIATLLPIPIAVATQKPWLIVYVIVIPGLIQNIIGNVIEPKVMGKGLNLHPVTILLALSFWGLLWGIPGMFLAAPLTAVVRIILVQFDTLRPLGRLLAGKLPASKTPTEKE